MTKILVNYVYNKNNDTYSLVNSDFVFVDLPIAVMDINADYKSILVVPINGQNTVVDKDEYLSKNKLFKLVADKDGNIREDQNGVPTYLPKDTDLTKLMYINGQLVLVEDKKEGE